MAEETRPLAGDVDDVPENWRPKRGKGPLIFALIVLIAIGVGVWQVFFVVRPRPNRVIVLINTQTVDGKTDAWWHGDQGPSRDIASALNKELDELGLEVVRMSDAMEALDGVSDEAGMREAARQLRAGYAIIGELRATDVRGVTGSVLQDVTLELDLALLSTLDDAGAVPIHVAPIRMHDLGPSEADAIAAAGERVPTISLAAIAGSLGETPLVVRLRKSAAGDLSQDELILAGELKKLISLANQYLNELERRITVEAEASIIDIEDERGPEKNLIGDFLGEAYFVSLGPGADVIIERQPRTLVLDKNGADFELHRGYETLIRVTPDGIGERVFETFNIFSEASVSASGETAAVVLDQHQVNKALTLVDLDDGTSTELLRHPRHYFSGPKLAPDGKRTTFWYRECRRRCPSSLEVIDADGSGRKVLVSEFAFMWVPRWAPDGGQLYVAFRPERGAKASLWAIDPQTAEAKPLLGEAAPAAALEPAATPAPPPEAAPEVDTGEGGEPEAAEESPAPPEAPPPPSEFQDIDIAPDGSFLVVNEVVGRGESWLGRLELATGKYERVAQLAIERLALSPDGRRVAVETKTGEHPDDVSTWDTEIVVVPLDGGAPTFVTINGKRDILHEWSRDGTRIYFSQSGRDPEYERRRTHRVFWVTAPD